LKGKDYSNPMGFIRVVSCSLNESTCIGSSLLESELGASSSEVNETDVGGFS